MFDILIAALLAGLTELIEELIDMSSHALRHQHHSANDKFKLIGLFFLQFLTSTVMVIVLHT